MVNRTITNPDTSFSGSVAGYEFVAGVATGVDDATPRGAKAIAFALRHKWGVSGGPAAVEPTVPQGKPRSRWNLTECRAYLDSLGVIYPADATLPELQAVIKDGYDMKAQGGSATNKSAGQDSESAIVVDGKPGTNPEKPDDAAENAKYSQPLTNGAGEWVEPTITTQPADASVEVGADHTFTVVAAGTPAVEYQWETAAGEGDAFEAIEDATTASYTVTGATEDQSGSRYRVVVTNERGEVTSAPATLTVTPA